MSPLKQRKGLLVPVAFLMALAMVAAAMMATPKVPAEADAGSPSGNGVQPVEFTGNFTCSQLLTAGDFLFEFKYEPVVSATGIPLSFNGLSGTLDVNVRNTSQGQVFDFTFHGDFVAAGVFVKGGPGGNLYDYRPDGEDADTGLHSHINPSTGGFYGLSHISFCVAEAAAELEITKTAVDDTITVGDHAAFDITVTSLGPATARNVTIDDSLPNSVLDWEVVSEDITGACSIPDGNTLHCDVGDLAPSEDFSVRVQTTEPIALGSELCGETRDNTAFAVADNADQVNDDASISVICGAVQVNKFAKVPGTTDTQPVAGAGFTLFDNGTAINPPGEVTTDAFGVACFDGLPVNTQFRLSETTTPSGYATVADQQVFSSAGNADCGGTGTPTTVDVENLALTDISIDVSAQVPGATNSTILCKDSGGTEVGNSGAFADPASLDITGLTPGTYVCTIVIDP